MNDQNCPLCDTPAEYATVSAPIAKRYTCAVCGQFFIDRSSEEYIHGMVEVFKTEQRQRLSKMSGASSTGRVLVLRQPNNDELQADANCRMIVDWIT